MTMTKPKKSTIESLAKQIEACRLGPGFVVTLYTLRDAVYPAGRCTTNRGE